MRCNASRDLTEDRAVQRRKERVDLPKEFLRRTRQVPQAAFEILLELPHEGFEHIVADGPLTQLPMKGGDTSATEAPEVTTRPISRARARTVSRPGSFT